MTVHLLTSQRGQEYETGCGLGIKSKDMPEDVSAWTSCITCVLCHSRIALHQRIKSWENLLLLLDLNNKTIVRCFSFAGKRLRFRWPVGTRSIYVFEDADAPHASYAIPVEDDLTYEQVQATAKLFILRQMTLFGEACMAEGFKYEKKHSSGGRSAPPPVPTGPHCDICKKKDEGDCVESPADPALLRCMTCFIKLSR